MSTRNNPARSPVCLRNAFPSRPKETAVRLAPALYVAAFALVIVPAAQARGPDPAADAGAPPAVLAQAPAPASPSAPPAAPAPRHATTRVADNVYVFRMIGHQAMFVVTPDGVIATDPVGFVDKQGGATFLAEMRDAMSAARSSSAAPELDLVRAGHNRSQTTRGARHPRWRPRRSSPA